MLGRHRVLKQNGGIEFGLGQVQWELAGCLLLAWLVVYFIICKGLHSSGKVKKKKTIFRLFFVAKLFSRGSML
jgi:hypothetical protein